MSKVEKRVRRWIARAKYANANISAYQLLEIVEGHKLSKNGGKWYWLTAFERNAKLANKRPT